MKRYIRDTIQVLEGLGFTYVEEDPFGRKGKRKYTHPYEPDTPLRLYDGATESACKAIQAKAYSIAEIGTSGPALPKTIGERKKDQTKKKAQARAQRDRENQARTRRAEAAEREHAQFAALRAQERGRREIESLMRPGNSR